MIAVDTNILVYADRRDTPQHESAARALRALSEGPAAWALPVFCIGEFLRVVTHRRVFQDPTPMTDALESIDSLLASPSVRLLSPGPGFFPLLRESIDASDASGNLVFDASIVAVCLEHGARTLLTEDRDFARFRAVETRSLRDFQA